MRVLQETGTSVIGRIGKKMRAALLRLRSAGASRRRRKAAVALQ